MGDKTIPDLAEPRLESFYPPFIGIDLPHQGVVDSYKLHWQAWVFYQIREIAGPCLNIKTVFPRYGDSHVKDKTVGETVLSLTWESLYW